MSGTVSSGVSALWVWRLSKNDTFSPNFFPEVHRLLPHTLTIAPCCRQHFSGCQLLITPSNLDFWWFLSQLGSKKARFLFRWSQASAFCGFHFIPWNILPFAPCMWKAILHPVWPCKQVKLQLCLQPSHLARIRPKSFFLKLLETSSGRSPWGTSHLAWSEGGAHFSLTPCEGGGERKLFPKKSSPSHLLYLSLFILSRSMVSSWKTEYLHT